MLSVDHTLDREKLLDLVGFWVWVVMLQDPQNSNGDRDVSFLQGAPMTQPQGGFWKESSTV